MTTLILSGWAQPADALAHVADDTVLFDYSDYPSIDAALEALHHIPHTTCIAWSLGGVVALHAIAAGVLRPKHLTLIGVPYQFVRSEGFAQAMDDFTYSTFRENYVANPARTKERFHALVAKGDRDVKRVMTQLQHHAEVENTRRWLPWLEWLAQPKQHTEHHIPTLLVHGMQDAIVPHAQVAYYEKIFSQASTSLWAEAGHAPHLHDPARLRSEITAHRKSHSL